MKRNRVGFGSLDMLLDTMCNTLGGVCFIALTIAIISAALPKIHDETDDSEEVAEKIVVMEIARLQERRDELSAALEIQKTFVENANTGAVTKADILKLTKNIADNDDQIEKYEKMRIEYLDELAKLRTKTAYSKREAARLNRLLAEMNEKIGSPLFDRHRVVRTPREHQEFELKTIDVWLYKHRLYLVDDRQYVEFSAPEYRDGKRCRKAKLINETGGILNDEFFLDGEIWKKLKSSFGEKMYVRIFVDTSSFNELCLLRDALISCGVKYNWIVTEKNVISFFDGYDGHIQ